jgi:hypothetical protein
MSTEATKLTTPSASLPPLESKTSDFIVGNSDPHGEKIVRVYCAAPEYKIYRTELGIRVFIDEDHLAPSERIHQHRFLLIGLELCRLYSLQPEALKKVESINKQVARGVQQCLEGNLENAKILLIEATDRLIRLRKLQGRIEYLSGTLLVLAIAIIINIWLAVMSTSTQEAVTYSQVIACGAIGGFLSVALGVWTLDIDPDASSLLNLLAGASRIVIASLAAVIALFAVASNLIFGTLSVAGNSYGILMIACIAGFSEAFIPNVIKHISSEEEKSN